MTPTVALIAMGEMGAAVGRRFAENGVTVLTSLDGRGEASRRRAEAAGMRDAPLERLAAADLFLSIVPPGSALELAERMAPALQGTAEPAVYVDCNAVSPATVERIGAVVRQAGAAFVDAGIIGGPPRPGAAGPRLYASGEHAARFSVLAEKGLDVRVLDGPVGAASALKMAYGGISKGLIAIASAMMLGATRAGAAEALYKELAESQGQLLAQLTRTVPGMYGKAYRWVAEMEEIAGFLAEDPAAAQIYEGMAQLYTRLAADAAGPRREIGALDAFLGNRH